MTKAEKAKLQTTLTTMKTANLCVEFIARYFEAILTQRNELPPEELACMQADALNGFYRLKCIFNKYGRPTKKERLFIFDPNKEKFVDILELDKEEQ